MSQQSTTSSSDQYLALSERNKDGALLLNEDEVKIETSSNKYDTCLVIRFSFV